MGEFNKAQYDSQYAKNNYDRLNILVPKGTKDKWKTIAAEQGKSLNAFVVDAVNAMLNDMWIK